MGGWSRRTQQEQGARGLSVCGFWVSQSLSGCPRVSFAVSLRLSLHLSCLRLSPCVLPSLPLYLPDSVSPVLSAPGDRAQKPAWPGAGRGGPGGAAGRS